MTSKFLRPIAISAFLLCLAVFVWADDIIMLAQWDDPTTVRVSVASDGTEGNGSSAYSTISGDGRYVAFSSSSSNLVSDDTNDYVDVFIRDRLTKQVNRVPLASGEVLVNDGPIRSIDISDDGRYVTFKAYASNMGSGDSDEITDIFVHDQQTGQTTCVSVSYDGTPSDDTSYFPVISGDGRYIAFRSSASNLIISDTNESPDVFIYDQQTQETTLVSRSSNGTQGNKASGQPAISKDGRYVAFVSQASNLVGGDNNGFNDIFVRDLQAGETTLVSVATDGSQGNANSFEAAISADGRYVAFTSKATNLVPGGSRDTYNIFLRDRHTGETEQVSVTPDGSQANEASINPDISADGRYIIFESKASNLVADDTNEKTDIFIYDQVTARIEIASLAYDGEQGNYDAVLPSISSNGHYVVFASRSGNLVSSDTNGTNDIFVRGDEFLAALTMAQEGLPDPVQAGAQLTYTVRVTNTGSANLHAIITDTLPLQVIPTGILTWTPTITGFGGIWMEQIVVTPELSYEGPLTNVVQVSTAEGPTYIYTETSQVIVTPALSVSKRASDSLVQAGAQLTYTLSVTNTGNVTLTATVTDILPVNITLGETSGGTVILPAEPIIWPSLNLAPGDVWSETLLVTATLGYTGLLSNTVHVTSLEGAEDSDTSVVSVEESIAGLDVVNDSPTLLGEATTLTATVDAGSNVVTYTWAFGDGETGQGEVTQHTYPTVGRYTAVITAFNPVSVVSATSVVSITDVPIAELTVDNDSPTQIGKFTTLTATVAAGSNVTYTWRFGDGEVATGAIVTHTYPSVDTYTAVVTASNSVNAVSDTTTVIIMDMPITTLTAINDSPTSLGEPTTLTASVTGGSNVIYTWTLGDGKIDSGAVVTHIYPALGTYRAVVTAANNSQVITATTSVRILSFVYLPVIMKQWPPLPHQPTLHAIGNPDGDGNYTANWIEQPSRRADTYTLQEATDAAFTKDTREVCVTAQQSCDISNKPPGTYYYRVRGHNEWGAGPWSNIQAVTVVPPTPTNTPEPTSTHTPEPTPTSTPKPTETPAPQEVYILPNHYHRITSYGNLNVLGEVHNNTDKYAWFVKVSISLFNSDGVLIDTAYTFVGLDDLPPGERGCFSLSTSPPEDWAYFEFEPVNYDPMDPNWGEWIDITIFDDYGRQEGDNYKILGYARNDHDQRVEAVRIEGTLYDVEGTVIGCSVTWPSNDDLDPGQSSPFEFNYWGDRPTVNSYRLQTDGYLP